MSLRDKINREIGELFASNADMSWFQMERRTQSPIETAFAVSFEWFCRHYWMEFLSDENITDFSGLRGEWVHLRPQATILNFRVDFLITFSVRNRRPEALIVECDGHNFHDRTPEQASRDRERDRELTASGYRVFRFTGTDLNRRPIECATEIVEFILTRITASDL